MNILKNIKLSYYLLGTWPAFWLLASKRPLNWPGDGEIDIMVRLNLILLNYKMSSLSIKLEQ